MATDGAMPADRVGLGWRPELVAGIQHHLDRIDVLEVIADGWFDRPPAQWRALATLARQVPVLLHGVGMGLASAWPVQPVRLQAMARLVDKVRPLGWSEHLAFVRAGGIEIGHLAAPPRTAATVEGTLRNLREARRVVGSLPMLENIATLIDPPVSTLDESGWLGAIAEAADATLLLDLHNLHANALNFGQDPLARLRTLPLARVRCVHLAGGRWIGNPAATGRRLLDDHLHDPPEAVFGLLAELAARVPHALTVVVERDGAYPPIAELLRQLDLARAALAAGRARRRVPQGSNALPGQVAPHGADLERGRRVERLLASVYADAAARGAFLVDPHGTALRAGCAEQDAMALASLDRDGLAFAAASFAHKRGAVALPMNH